MRSAAIAAIVAAALGLAACGGGSSSDPAPTASLKTVEARTASVLNNKFSVIAQREGKDYSASVHSVDVSETRTDAKHGYGVAKVSFTIGNGIVHRSQTGYWRIQWNKTNGKLVGYLPMNGGSTGGYSSKDDNAASLCRYKDQIGSNLASWCAQRNL